MKEEKLQILGQRLKKLREEAGLTQEEVAKNLNITASGYGYYEQGRRDPDTDTLRKLAEFYNVSVDYLLGMTDIRNPNPHIPKDYKHEVTKRDLKQYEDFIENVKALFMNDEVAEEDKEKIFRDISEAFWMAKDINKKKYAKKKKPK